MKITQEVRDYAKTGMAEMAVTFREGGGEIYKPEDELETLKKSNQAFSQNRNPAATKTFIAN